MTIGVDRMSKVMQGAFSMVVPLTLYGASIGFTQWLFLRRHTNLSLEMAEPARMNAEFNRTLKNEKQKQT
jgi:hypothetical protein